MATAAKLGELYHELYELGVIRPSVVPDSLAMPSDRIPVAVYTTGGVVIPPNEREADQRHGELERRTS